MALVSISEYRKSVCVRIGLRLDQFLTGAWPNKSRKTDK
jgi:hypothetical protein